MHCDDIRRNVLQRYASYPTTVQATVHPKELPRVTFVEGNLVVRREFEYRVSWIMIRDRINDFAAFENLISKLVFMFCFSSSNRRRFLHRHWGLGSLTKIWMLSRKRSQQWLETESNVCKHPQCGYAFVEIQTHPINWWFGRFLADWLALVF